MRKRSPSSLSVWQLLLPLLFCFTTLWFTADAAADRKVKLPGDSRRSESREIENLEKQWRTAIVKGDLSIMDKLLSDDFLAISARGTLSDKQQYLHRIAIHATQFSSFDLMDMKVRLQPGSAVAISQAHITGVLEGHPIEGVFRYTKVYVRSTGGVWRISNFEATRVSATATDAGDMDHGVPLAGRHPDRSEH